MVRHTPQYNRISELCRDLHAGGGGGGVGKISVPITRMRAAGDQLMQLLGDEKVRSRLALEATPDDLEPGEQSVKAIQRRALAQIWRLVVTSAITSVEKIVESGKKLTDNDIFLPHKLLRLSLYTDELFDKDTRTLSKKEYKSLYEYCLNLLYNDKVLEIDGVEKILLQMLAEICSYREFVVYFRPDQQVLAVLEEVEKRLIMDGDEPMVDKEIAIICANIFKNLMKTLFELGIGLHLILSSTIKMVATWCHQKKRDEDEDENEFPPIISGAAILLRSCPDLAIEPLARYGRSIFIFVRRRMTRQQAAKIDSSLMEYVLRHL